MNETATDKVPTPEKPAAPTEPPAPEGSAAPGPTPAQDAEPPAADTPAPGTPAAQAPVAETPAPGTPAAQDPVAETSPPAAPAPPPAGPPVPALPPVPPAPPADTPNRSTRLVRSRSDKMIGGVCGGLAKVLNIDPLILRLALVLATVLGFGAGVVLYVACWILMPEEDQPTQR